ncbi:MAG: hypothetical protein V3S16_16065 [Candidatus Desulfatibia sp.]|uniref:hypothetical protein n=1 Tax=Candidatus Desulfatibia sp. TaxID=3101189 RepID=UPI002F3444D8
MSIQKIQEKWLRFTAETNALDFLERAGEFIQQTESDIKAWKWVILSLHGALYGFAICACRSTDYENIIHRTKKGVERLISFDDALRICQDSEWMGTLGGGKPLEPTESQQYSIKMLKKSLRNNFEHYIPKGWSIEIHGLPIIAIDILDIIRFLSVETFRYQHLNQSQRRRIKSIIFQSKKLLKKSTLYQEVLMAQESKTSA